MKYLIRFSKLCNEAIFKIKIKNAEKNVLLFKKNMIEQTPLKVIYQSKDISEYEIFNPFLETV